MTSQSFCQTSQTHSPEGHGSMQTIDNGHDVIFMCYEYNVIWIAME